MIDWCGSPPVTVDGSADSRLVYDANGSVSTAMWDIRLRTDNYIADRRLTRIPRIVVGA